MRTLSGRNPTSVVLGVVFVVVGGLLAFATVPTALRGGYVSSESKAYATGGRALVLKQADSNGGAADTWSDEMMDDGKYRVSVEGRNGKTLFVGVAREDQALGAARQTSLQARNCVPTKGYLSGVAHLLIGAGRIEEVPPVALGRLEPPEQQSFWISSASSDRPRATWGAGPPPRLGPGPCKNPIRVIVVMNADASPGVAADVRFEARVLPLSIIVVALAGAFVVIGLVLVVIGLRLVRQS